MAKAIEYKTAKGANVKIRIETEEENNDSNFSAPCFDFVVEVSPYGNIGPVKLINGNIFQARSPRTVNGKLVKVAVLASPEAIALYTDYKAEVSRRIDSDLADSAEYEKHHAAVTAMMNR